MCLPTSRGLILFEKMDNRQDDFNREKAVKEISRMRYWTLAWGGGRDSWTEHGEGRPAKEVIHLLKSISLKGAGNSIPSTGHSKQKGPKQE